MKRLALIALMSFTPTVANDEGIPSTSHALPFVQNVVKQEIKIGSGVVVFRNDYTGEAVAIFRHLYSTKTKFSSLANGVLIKFGKVHITVKPLGVNADNIPIYGLASTVYPWIAISPKGINERVLTHEMLHLAGYRHGEEMDNKLKGILR